MEKNTEPKAPVQLELDITETVTDGQSESKTIPYTEWSPEEVQKALAESREHGGAWGDIGGLPVRHSAEIEEE